MAAFAVVTMPLDLSRRSAAASIALDLVETFPGTRNVRFDPSAAAVTFELQFPGNLSELVARLRANSILAGERAGVAVPVLNLAPEILAGDPDLAARRLNEGPEVWDAQFDRAAYVDAAHVNGDVVEASIVPCTSAMHELYDALLTLGLVAHGAAEPAA